MFAVIVPNGDSHDWVGGVDRGGLRGHVGEDGGG